MTHLTPFTVGLNAAAICLAAGTLTATASTVLYKNDLGTPEQFGTFTVTTEGGATANWDSHAPTTNYPDFDSDGVAGHVRYDDSGFGRVYLDRTWYAPLYSTVSTPEFSATGTGYNSSNAARTRIDIGTGGAFVESAQTTGNVASDSPVPLAVTLDGAAYEKLLSVDMQGRLEVRSGSLPPSAGRPRIGNIQLQGDVNAGEVGDRVWVYKNDFGTQASVDEWTVQGQSITTSISPTVEDLDGDDLASRLVGDSEGNFDTTLDLQIDAPTGFQFSDPILMARARGHMSAWGTGVTISLSADGVDYSQVSVDTGDEGTTELLASADGLSDFQNLSSLWVRVELDSGNVGGNFQPFLENILVSGELSAIPEPASASLAGAGALLLLTARRSRPRL